MRNMVWVIVLLVLAGGIAVGFFLWKSTQTRFEVVLQRESGSVLFRKNQGDEYEEMSSDEITLSNLTWVKTEDGLAHVIFPNGSLMSVAQDTELQIIHDKQITTIVQLIGHTWHRIEKLAGVEEYQVETPTALATVRGTIFGVNVDPENASGSSEVAGSGSANGVVVSSIFVTESQVEVAQIEKVNNIRKILAQKMLSTGNEAQVFPVLKQRAIALRSIAKEHQDTEWFKRNQIIDGEFKTLVQKRKIQLRKTLPSRLKELKKENRLPIPVRTLRPAMLQNLPGLPVASASAFPRILPTLLPSFSPILEPKRPILNRLLNEKSVTGEVLSSTIDTEIPSFSPPPSPQLPVSDAFSLEINARISKYTAIGDGKSVCQNYTGISVAEILGQFSATEAKYNVRQVAAEQFEPTVTAISGFCQDGFVDETESKRVQALLPSPSPDSKLLQ